MVWFVDVCLTVNQPLDIEDFFMSIESDDQRMIEVVGQFERYMAADISLMCSDANHMYFCACYGFPLVVKDQ